MNEDTKSRDKEDIMITCGNILGIIAFGFLFIGITGMTSDWFFEKYFFLGCAIFSFASIPFQDWDTNAFLIPMGFISLGVFVFLLLWNKGIIVFM